MLFGRGERMSPITQAKGCRKPGIEVTPANIEIRGVKKALTAIEEALFDFIPVAKYLEKRKFRGILDKWSDETEIASIDLTKDPGAGESLADHDIIKTISVMEITDELARQKDWVFFDEEGKIVPQLFHNDKKILIEQLKKLGIKSYEDGKYYAGISLGPVAVSYDVLDIASNVFANEIEEEGVYFDFDSYLLMAFAMEDDDAGWKSAVRADKGLCKLSEDTDLRDKKNTYNVSIFNNDISFDEAYNEMFGTSMEELEIRHRKMLEHMKRIKILSQSFKP
jgi:hypothetical protein